MNETIARNWIAALRSGEYAQGRECLCEERTISGKKTLLHDALGVLCELATKEERLHDGVKLTRSQSTGSGTKYVFDGAAGMLPPRVARWADMKQSGWRNLNGRDGGSLSLRGDYAEGLDLIKASDDGKSFSEIADIIEKNWRAM